MPDLNSVPPSPRVPPGLIRQSSSQQMRQPLSRTPSLNILPSNQSAVNGTGSALPSPSIPTSTSLGGFPLSSSGGDSSVGPGPGPVRHPRPLTAAELHLQLEREQEAVVNRLTRELQMLRAAHNASTVSNASSTSASASGTEPGGSSWTDTNPPYRHHRTSSNASARSFTLSSAAMTGISSPVPIRSTAIPPVHHQQQPIPGNTSISRQNSTASRHSRTGSPSPAPAARASLPSSYRDNNSSGSVHPAMMTRSYSGSTSSALPTPATGGTSSASDLSPGILPGTSRYEETARRRAELEEAKKENEALRKRVRELELLIKEVKEGKKVGAEGEGKEVGDVAQAGAGGAAVQERGEEDVVSTGAGRGRGRVRE